MTESVLLEVAAGEYVLFGLRWQALLGSTNRTKQAKARAREYQATHYVYAQTDYFHAEAVGLAKLTKHQVKQVGRGKVYAAAAIFATRQRRGAICWVVRLPSGQLWFLAANNGTVISQSDFSVSAERARELIEHMRSRFDAVTVHGEDEPLELDPVTLRSALPEEACLQPVRLSLSSVPPPLLVVAGTLVGVLLVQQGWKEYRAYRDRVRLEALRGAQVDPELAWKQALQDFSNSVLVGPPQSMEAVVDKLLDLPMDVSGWKLRQVNCRLTGAQWQCQAIYDRGKYATNEDFAANAPLDWRIRWEPLDRSSAQFVVPADLRPLDTSTLRSYADFERYLLSDIQRAAPAAQRIELSAPLPAEIPPPRDSGELAIPRPSNVQLPRKVDLTIAAPLRSLSLLSDDVLAQTAWRSLAITVAESASADLVNSQLLMELKGTIYAK